MVKYYKNDKRISKNDTLQFVFSNIEPIMTKGTDVYKRVKSSLFSSKKQALYYYDTHDLSIVYTKPEIVKEYIKDNKIDKYAIVKGTGAVECYLPKLFHSYYYLNTKTNKIEKRSSEYPTSLV